MDFRYGLRVLLACVLIFSAPAAAGDNQHYVMATGVPGTKPYVIGVTLQSLINLKLMPEGQVALKTLLSDNYTENLWAMGDGRSQFAIADSVTIDAATNSKGAFQAARLDRELKAVAVLWQEVDYFLIENDRAVSGTITDLVALTSDKIATSPVNRDATRALLAALGMQTNRDDEALPVFDGPGQLDAISNGSVAALAITRSLPSTDTAQVVDELGGRAQLLEFTGRQSAQLGQAWHRHPIPADAYASLDHDIETIARTVMLIADGAVDEGTVYLITRTMFENLPFLVALDETAALITLDNALEGMTLPLHPGAARFYQEVSLLPSVSTDPANAL